jgi:hypothetical protein
MKFLSVTPETVKGWAPSSAPDANSGTSPVVAHDENPHDIANDTKQEMIREALQIHAAEITLANREGFRPLGAACNVVARRKIRQRVLASQPARNIP